MAERLQDIYAQKLVSGALQPDAAQRAVLPLLQDIREHLETTQSHPAGLLNGLFHRAGTVPRGLYLWGGVGRGKTMLMNMFFDHLGIPEKRRVHFHAFMQEVHAALAIARTEGRADPISAVAQQMTQRLRLLAFDEMQISDIADAMIIGRLFEKMFLAGVVIVTTSNRAPDALYKNGLNRELFLPFIEMIKNRMMVTELASPTDYRNLVQAGNKVWFSPNDRAAKAHIDKLWHALTGGVAAPLVLHVQGRKLVLPAAHKGMARATFHELCHAALGPADYLAIAASIQLLVLTDIPALGRDNFNEAKRFVTLIDTFYEAGVRLIASAAAQPEMLYIEGEGSFEFERTASRLREMMGTDWARHEGPSQSTARR